MKWLGVTVALLTTSLVLVIWIFLRDRHVPDWHPSPAAVAQEDARTVLAALKGYHCHGNCDYQLLGSNGSRWLTRVTVPWGTRCFEIDIKTFEFSPKNGLSGLARVTCPVQSAGSD
jgi:hypothetical protein